MSCKTKVIIAVVVTSLLTFFITREFVPEYQIQENVVDTTITISETENLFTSSQVGNIKVALTDSLKRVYGSIIDQLTTKKTPVKGVSENPEKNSLAYISEIDTAFISHDSSGRVTDSIFVKSTFISPEPLPSSSIHLLNIRQKNFEKEVRVSSTSTVIKQKGFFERFRIVPNISAGVGLIHKQFDVYAGLGISYEL